MRRRCARRGHSWVGLDPEGYRTPVQYCARWGCGARRPDPLLPGVDRRLLATLIREGRR